MLRSVSLEEISDGKFYRDTDMVRVDCGDCAGCSRCCRESGNTIVLDPLDLYRMTAGTGKTFAGLTEHEISLQVVDQVILPYLNLQDGKGCVFLDENGRCRIHDWRPGYCRIFPLGRYWQEDGYQYILQVQECPKPNKTKIRVEKWIAVDCLEENRAYLIRWHQFLKQFRELLATDGTQEQKKQLSLYVLQNFYGTPYQGEKERDFYPQFEERCQKAEVMFR